MNLVETLNELAQLQPAHIALKDCRAGKKRSISYWNLLKQVEHTALHLVNAGVEKNSRVLLAVSLSIETYIILLALFRIGAVAVIVDASHGMRTLNDAVAMVTPQAVIFDKKTWLLSLMSKEIRRISSKIQCDKIVADLGSDIECKTCFSAKQFFSAENLPDAHPALITFTSGSTGLPKAILRTHGFLNHQQNVLSKSLPCRNDEVELTTLPVFVLSALANGITAVLPDCNMRKPDRIDAARIAEQIESCRINRIIASPAFLSTLCEYLKKQGTNLQYVRKIFTGGGPVFPSLLKKLETVFPRAEIVSVYGSTEAEPIAHIEAREISQADLAQTFSGKGLLAGLPVPEIELRIADFEALNSRTQWREDIPTLPTNTVGEILVTGNHVVKTYIDGRGNAETKIAIKTQTGQKVWHRTGDAGYIDDEGRLWLMGRCASKIDDAQGEVYPFQVEAAASEISSLRRATCLRSDSKRILVVEKKQREFFSKSKDEATTSVSFVQTIRNAFSWLHFDEIRIVSKIPMDVRHSAKIQYSQLEKQMRFGISLTL